MSVRQAMRAALTAIFFTLAPSEHESMWSHIDGRPVAVLAVGQPVPPLVARRR